jgi:hypothetical protein
VTGCYVSTVYNLFVENYFHNLNIIIQYMFGLDASYPKHTLHKHRY